MNPDLNPLSSIGNHGHLDYLGLDDTQQKNEEVKFKAILALNIPQPPEQHQSQQFKKIVFSALENRLYDTHHIDIPQVEDPLDDDLHGEGEPNEDEFAYPYYADNSHFDN